LDISENQGDFYGVKTQDIKRMANSEGDIYIVLNRSGSEKLKALYGERVVRVFIYVGLNELETRYKRRGMHEEEIMRLMFNYEMDIGYGGECEYVYNSEDMTHTIFDLTQTLEPYLERNLIEWD
jgi:guanylate kinase